jgi:Yip1-like protein
VASFVDRMVGAAKLNAATYEEVEADIGATGQALIVVFISALAIIVGNLGTGQMNIFASFLGGLLGWGTWILVVWVVGVKLMPEPATKSNPGELIRTTGFAATPGLLRVFGVIPLLGWLVVIVAWLWTLAAMIVAVRQALDYQSTARAVAVCVIGFIGQLGVLYLEWWLLRTAMSV